jgi:hypothetical protein
MARIPLEDPICVYDFAEKLGVEVRFVGGSSFAGIFAKGMDVVFVPSERPAGRRAFTCAHELAHWRFGHGERVEKLDFDRNDRDVPEEILANFFAGYVLMPARALHSLAAARSMDFGTLTAINAYRLASQLGVGYGTLIKHLRWSERLIDQVQMEQLELRTPKDIRRELLGHDTSGHLVVADRQWARVAIDLEVGDHAIVPHGVDLTGNSARIVRECSHGSVIEALRPGISQAIGAGDWASMVRVSRRQYVGRGTFRHLEDDENDTTLDN